MSFNPKREAHPLQTFSPCDQRGDISVSIPNGKPILFRPETGNRMETRFKCFNPKREAHPLQTRYRDDVSLLPQHRFNPKREAHPLQTTWRITIQPMSATVSIPNGKPILFRRATRNQAGDGAAPVSIPNGKPILFRLSMKMGGPNGETGFNPKREAHPLQTLRDSLRDSLWDCFNPKREAHPLQTGCQRKSSCTPSNCFNPKREAHPLQTCNNPTTAHLNQYVSIPNGKPILFRPESAAGNRNEVAVSIPNGKPILFRQSSRKSFACAKKSFNPKREAHPLQTPLSRSRSRNAGMFQSQTGSPSSSDPVASSGAKRLGLVSIPNGKPILFRQNISDA